MAVKRAHIYYRGSVQGVGFRFGAERTAVSLGIKGWVKNLYDGSVETVCEGDEGEINMFLGKMADSFRSYIRDVDIEWSGATDEFSGFDIRLD